MFLYFIFAFFAFFLINCWSSVVATVVQSPLSFYITTITPTDEAGYVQKVDLKYKSLS